MAQMIADEPIEKAADPQTFAIIGAAMIVHSELGCGFLEQVYQEALAIEFRSRGIQFEREAAVTVKYKGETLNACYRADFICYESIIVEMKAISALSNDHTSQVLNYLKATGFQRGLLLNFGEKRLNYKRLVLNYQ